MCFFLRRVGWLTVWVYLFELGAVQAQLNNEALTDPLLMSASEEPSLYLKVSNFNFLRNNEYFNNITTGQTFFGTQFSPSLVFYPNARIRLEVGGFFWKDFGDDNFTRLSPIFSFKYQVDSTSITFGNLQANYAHQLIEPLYAFERGITNRIESGIQILHQSRHWYVDLWVDWQNRIFPNSDVPEEIFGGLVTHYYLVQKPRFEMRLPFQATILHVGGQDLAVSTPVNNTVNLATGVYLAWTRPEENFIQKIRTQHYYVGSINSSSNDRIGTRDGLAYYGNFTLETTWLDLMLSLWLGNEYDSAQGGELYRSQSAKDERFFEAHRDLFFLRFLKDFELMEDLYFSLRLEPYYDFNKELLEYSFGFYVNYRPKFLLKKWDR